MKLLLALTLSLMLPISVQAGGVFEFQSPAYFIVLINHCERGLLDCRKIEFFSIEKNSGVSLRTKGKTIVGGNSPNFYGYEFKSGHLTYSIYLNGDQGNLRIEDKGKIIMHEDGQFKTLSNFE